MARHYQNRRWHPRHDCKVRKNGLSDTEHLYNKPDTEADTGVGRWDFALPHLPVSCHSGVPSKSKAQSKRSLAPHLILAGGYELITPNKCTYTCTSSITLIALLGHKNTYSWTGKENRTTCSSLNLPLVCPTRYDDDDSGEIGITEFVVLMVKQVQAVVLKHINR